MGMKIVQYGASILRQVSEDVTSDDFNDRRGGLKGLLAEMVDTMHEANGIGLSCVQVGILKRLFVMHLPEQDELPTVVINPVIEKVSRDFFKYDEGCLSLPGVLYTIERPRSLVLRYLDEEWKGQCRVAEELEAVCIQHELDHLNGKLFIDHVQGKMARRDLKALMAEAGYSILDEMAFKE